MSRYAIPSAFAIVLLFSCSTYTAPANNTVPISYVEHYAKPRHNHSIMRASHADTSPCKPGDSTDDRDTIIGKLDCLSLIRQENNR